ncbi:MAG: hypothetical protein AAAB13_20455 [Pseudomonas sp.]
MNMIEKVAQAIQDNIAAALPDGVGVDYRYAAIAAIEAMTKPSVDMLALGDLASIGKRLPAEECWKAMIDAALEGGDAN